jgi:hypothetical protein
MPAADQTRFSWITVPDSRHDVVKSLEDAGADVERRTGFEPLTIIAFASGLVVLARAVYRLFRDAKVRGVLIDATKDPVEIREMPGWQRSNVLVLTVSGPVFHDFAEAGEEDIASILEGLGIGA